MKITQRSFNKNLDKNILFEKSPQVAVAVSGGPDSMCLTFLLNNWIKKYHGTLIAIIINHQLREEAYQEAQIVKDYLLGNKIKSTILNVDKKNIIKKNMKEARDNRFDKLIKYCSKKNILHLFLGHHYDDNLETYLLRKLAGSNLEGLNGMQQVYSNQNLQILRPLLKYNKKELLLYNKKNKITYISDPSNLNFKYSRVIVRSFLSNNNLYKKEIKKDLKIIQKNYLPYKKMIYQKFNKLHPNIFKKKIIIDSKFFFREDLEIQSKIIEIIYKYLKPEKKLLRYKKILLILKILSIKNICKANLGGMHIKKGEFLINFGF